MTRSDLELRNVSLTLGHEPLIHRLNHTIGAGEILTLMGPSGSGKSSLLAYIAGVLPPDIRSTGEIRLGGTLLNPLPTAKRNVGILFQDPLLFPHMSVGENLAFSLPQGLRGKARQQQVDEALERADLSGYGNRDPATLSGGQQSRVSLMRTLLAKPRALLLDEPYSRLDQALRQHFRDHIQSLVEDTGLPTVLVTHDPMDAPTSGEMLQMTDLKQGDTEN